MKKLPIEFYNRKDVLLIARELLGKLLLTKIGGHTTAARIVETEAYIAITDRASHSYNGKRTGRNEHMYAAAGTSYVYICYGMHHLFNVVTNQKDIPDAVLVRAGEPVTGIDIMLQRTGKKEADYSLTKGPGNLGKALGISKQHSGLELNGRQIALYDDGFYVQPQQVGISKRIGVDGAGIAADYPYRFYIKGNRYVSAFPNK
ncbi:MAG: DNA-3-methyladenine glycosylase [Ferruginibacter sp.]